MSFPVAEKFTSINGESIRAGEPAVFIGSATSEKSIDFILCDKDLMGLPRKPFPCLERDSISLVSRRATVV